MMDFISTIPRPLLRHAVRRQRRIWVWIWIRAVWWYSREGWQLYGMGRRREIRVVFGTLRSLTDMRYFAAYQVQRWECAVAVCQPSSFSLVKKAMC